MEENAEREQDLCREKFQKKFKVDMRVFVCLFNSFFFFLEGNGVGTAQL